MKTSKIALHILYWLSNILIVLMLYSVLRYFIIYFPNSIKYWDILVEELGSMAIIEKISFITLLFLPFIPVIAFRNFMRNLRKELTFTEKNIKLLKKVTIGLIIFDLIHIIWYSIVFPITFTIDGQPAPCLIPFQVTVLFFALLMWGLRHILSNGLSLKQENDLTI